MLTATNIHKSFGDREILRGIDLAIRPGEITCVIGPSGTGKTTLLRALTFLDYPDTGSITLDDRRYDFPLMPKQELNPLPWPHVTAVFQSLFLWPHLTLRENVMLPARNRPDGDVEKDLEELIDFFEMRAFIDNYPNQASVGQRQRVALARALILNPHYLMLDEITSALDIEQTARILTKLEHLRGRNIGIFLITHAIGFARHAASNIVFMDGGVVVEQGPPTIIDKPQTERLQNFLSMVRAAQ